MASGVQDIRLDISWIYTIHTERRGDRPEATRSYHVGGCQVSRTSGPAPPRADFELAADTHPRHRAIRPRKEHSHSSACHIVRPRTQGAHSGGTEMRRLGNASLCKAPRGTDRAVNLGDTYFVALMYVREIS